MRHRFLVPAIVLASACALTGAAGARSAAHASPRAGASPRAEASSAADAGPTVWLPGGPAVTVTGGVAAAMPGDGTLAGTLVSLTAGGDSYVIPVDALPYLGHGLDPALFDTSTLLAGEKSGKLALRLSYTGQLPSIPGVTIIRSGGGTADGYLTRSSDQAFTAALASQYLADRGHVRSGAGGMFGRVTVGLPGAAASAPAARAGGPAMFTVNLTGTNLAGQPDTGDAVFLVNVDNSGITGDPRDTGSSFYQGSATFSVPAGHYFAIADFVDTSSNGTVTGERVVTVPEFTVAGGKTEHLDERTADSELSFATPRPTTLQATEYEVVRTPVTGLPISFGFFDQQPTSAWVAPTRTPVTTGALATYADGWLTSPAAAAAPYQYNLAYQGPAGVIPSGRYTVDPATLATVDSRYYSAEPVSAYLVSTSWFPYQASAFPPDVQRVQMLAPFIPVSLPQDRTEYFSAGPKLLWDTLLSDSGPAGGSFIEAGPFGTYTAGHRYAEGWNDYPQHPGTDANLTGGSFIDVTGDTLPSATRQGDVLSINVNPFTDNTPGHFSEGLEPDPTGTTVSGSYQITQNGTSVASGPLADGPAFAEATLTPGPATVAVTVTAARTGPAYPLSTRTVTSWTWRTMHETGSTLPAGWYCVDGTPDCDAEPMMTLEYDVTGLGLDGTAPAGPQTLGITPGHILPAAATAITGLKAQVSFDDGTTWHAATVTGSGTSYQAHYTAPAGSFVTLKVTATDAAGGRVAETITRAYRTAAA